MAHDPRQHRILNRQRARWRRCRLRPSARCPAPPPRPLPRPAAPAQSAAPAVAAPPLPWEAGPLPPAAGSAASGPHSRAGSWGAQGGVPRGVRSGRTALGGTGPRRHAAPSTPPTLRAGRGAAGSPARGGWGVVAATIVQCVMRTKPVPVLFQTTAMRYLSTPPPPPNPQPHTHHTHGFCPPRATATHSTGQSSSSRQHERPHHRP